jgi:FkbM family methyltransferase
MGLKDFVRQIIPYGLCEYSVRRHEYIRMGINNGAASFAALSRKRYQNLCDARLNFVPKSILTKLRTCVDAGAHAGSWTAALLEPFQPARIIAVECEPRLVGPLKAKFGGLPQVRVVEAALAENEGRARFHQLQHPAGSSLLMPRADVTKEFLAGSWEVIGTPDVPTIGYDQLVAAEEEISILKLDIQGAEFAVVTASQTGLQKTKSIIMEVTFTPHYEHDAGFSELHPLVSSKGFGLYRLSAPYDRGGRILYSDAIYVREDLLHDLTALR